MLSNVAHELNEADERILDALTEGRNTPQNIANELDYSRQYVQNRLQMLKAADYVENVGGGLYELIEDPRSSGNYTQIGDDLDWEKLQPVWPHSAERLEYVIAALEAGDELEDGFHWTTVLADTPHGAVTIEEVLGALGEAKGLLKQRKEEDTDD